MQIICYRWRLCGAGLGDLDFWSEDFSWKPHKRLAIVNPPNCTSIAGFIFAWHSSGLRWFDQNWKLPPRYDHHHHQERIRKGKTSCNQWANQGIHTTLRSDKYTYWREVQSCWQSYEVDQLYNRCADLTAKGWRIWKFKTLIFSPSSNFLLSILGKPS